VIARLIALTCALAAVACAAPAGAHVTIAPHQLAAGTVDELTFRCPNERANAATTKLVVQLPPDYPLTLVKVRPIPGWHVTVTTRKLATPLHSHHGDILTAVDTIAWDGGTIRPGEYQDFSILAGPMPHGTKRLAFKAVQTYSNGEVVRWIDVREAGEPEPPHPAPILELR
jgi:uncharacterized protein YcnI